MDPTVFDDALILTGPTASGKSAVALILAKRLGAEIVAMDSMTLYRGMDVGTAKPSQSERSQVPHHLIDVLDPWEAASLAWWLERAAESCLEIRNRGQRALFVGGTPLYLKGLLRGIFEGPAADAEFRGRLAERPTSELHDKLASQDPVAAARIHVNDRRRLIRALEVHHATGQPMSQLQQQFAHVWPRKHPPIWLDPPRDQLYDRINRRVDEMVAKGLVAEVQRLLELTQPPSKEARQALGYKEVLDHLASQRDWPTTLELIKTRSRQFAKRQLTWFRHLPECVPLSIDGGTSPGEIAERVVAKWGTEP